MKKRLQVGIIGTGKHGSRYAGHIVSDLTASVKLQAISRRSAKEGQKQSGLWDATFHRDWQDLIASPEVEAVIATTTPNLNPAIASLCVDFNKPLLMEKPLATEIKAAEKMVADLKRVGLPLTVGQTLRYNPVITSLKRLLPRAGKLHTFCATHRLEPSDLPWLTDPMIAGGGVIFHTAVHLFDALRFITGVEVKRVRASSFKRLNANLEDLFTAQIEMENDLVGIVEASKVSKARSGRYEFIGEQGHLYGDQVHGSLNFVEQMQITPFHTASAQTILPLLKDWSSFLAGKGSNPIPGEDGLAAVRICDACRKSSEQDCWVGI